MDEFAQAGPDHLFAKAAPATLALSAPSKGWATRCTVLGFTANLATVLRTLMPPARAALIRSASLFAIGGRPSRLPSRLALLNYRALELGKDAQHLKHRLAGRCGRVETLLMQKQVDAERVKLGQERHKVFQAAPQAIDVPGHHDVELALGGVPAQCIECRSSIAAFSAADAMISVDLRHLPVGPLCRLA